MILKNKKVFSFVFFLSILIFGFLFFSSAYAVNLGSSSITVNTTGLSSQTTITITVSGNDINNNPLPSKVINLIINPYVPPLSATISSPASCSAPCNITVNWTATNFPNPQSIATFFSGGTVGQSNGTSLGWNEALTNGNGSGSAVQANKPAGTYIYCIRAYDASWATGNNLACTTTVVNPTMSGTLTPSASSCTISSGGNSCNINLSWTTTNPVATSAVTASGMSNVVGNSGTNVSFVVPYSSRTFYLYNNSILLAQSTVTAVCTSGTAWNGSSCAVVSNPVPFVSFSANPLAITVGSSTTLTWSATNTPISCTASSSPVNSNWNGAKGVTGPQTISGLTVGTQTFSLYCTNANGNSVTANQSVVVSASATAPTVTSPTHITITSGGATLGANITSDGGASITARGTCWGTTTNPSTNCVADGATATGIFTQIRTGMSANTLYYYRGYATNSVGTSYSTSSSFTTLSSATIPTITTVTPVTNITPTTATGGGNITSNGGSTVTTSGIVWSTSTNPTTALSTKTTNGWALGGPWTSDMTGLTANTLYYVRAYATNSAGTAYGNNVTFTTSAAVGGGVVNPSCSDGGAGYSTGGTWLYRKIFQIDDSKVPSTQSNFPVLINLTSDAGLQVNAQADGDDILFTDSSGTKLSHEIEKYNSTTGQLIAWVKMPSLLGSGLGDTKIYMYYGNSSATNQQNKTGVWDANYLAVWHFPNGTTLSALDSTSNANNGTIVSAIAAAGYLGGGLNPNNGRITGSNINLASIPFTVESWHMPTGSYPTYGKTIFSLGSSATTDKALHLRAQTNTTVLFGLLNDDFSVSVPAQLNLWNLTAITMDTSKLQKVYQNGSFVLSRTSGGLFTGNTTWVIGDDAWSFNSKYAGTIDELRISNVVRSADWIKTGYDNQSNQATFYGMSPQCPLLIPTITTVTPVTNITPTTATGGGNITSNGGSTVTTSGIVWSTSTNPTTALSTKTTNGWALGGPWTSDMTGLTANTLYYVRAYATNSAGTAYGNNVTFTTTATLPPPTNPVGTCPTPYTTAHLSWTAPAGYNNFYVRLNYSSRPNNGYDWTPPIIVTEVTGTTWDPPTTSGQSYTWWVSTKNIIDGSWSTDLVSYNLVCSPATIPTITTVTPVTNITPTTATGGGNITSNGGSTVTTSGIVWSTSTNPTTALSTKTTNGWAIGGPWPSGMTGLTANTLYYVRAYATNSAGTAYGNNVTFTTTATPVNGAPGTANGQTYPSGTTTYGSDTQCSYGTSSNTAFPAIGSVTYWNCLGLNGGTDGGPYSASRSSPSVNFTASLPTIFIGDSVTLTWSTTAISCTGTNFNTAGAPSGNLVVSPTSTTTYTLTCDGVSAQVIVTVKKKPIFIED